MKSGLYSWIVTILVVTTGAACVLGGWSLLSVPEKKLEQNKVRFSELSSQEQADLRSKAAVFADAANCDELARLKAIHQAVEREPQLMTKLEHLDDFLPSVDADTKAKLKPDGNFADDWKQQIERLAGDESIFDEKFYFAPRFFLIYSRKPFVVPAREYEEFLNSTVENEWQAPAVIQQYIDGEDRSLRRLFKGIAVAQRLAQDPSGQFGEEVFEKAKQSLVPEEARVAVAENLKRFLRSRGDEDKASVNRKIAFLRRQASFAIIETGLSNSHKYFLKQHDSENAVTPEDFVEYFERAEQLDLMTKDPDTVAQELAAKTMREASVTDPFVVTVNEHWMEAQKAIRKAREEMSRFRPRGEGFGWGRDGRRGNGPEGRGRGPGDRPPNERGPGDRGSVNRDGDGRPDEGGSGFDRNRRGEGFGGRRQGPPRGPEAGENKDRPEGRQRGE